MSAAHPLENAKSAYSKLELILRNDKEALGYVPGNTLSFDVAILEMNYCREFGETAKIGKAKIRSALTKLIKNINDTALLNFDDDEEIVSIAPAFFETAVLSPIKTMSKKQLQERVKELEKLADINLKK